MNKNEKDVIDTSKLDEILPKYEPIKLSGKNLAQNYVSAFNTGMNIYQCVNYLQGNIDWTIKAVNDVVKSLNDSVDETLSKSIKITKETTTEQFNEEWTAKQPELIEQVNTLTTNQFNNEKSVFNDELDTLNARMDTFSNPNLLINPDFKINQRGQNTYSSTGEIYTVDRWSASNLTAIVNSDGTITISSLSGLGYFNYRSENILYGKHAYSFYVQAITGDVTVYYRNKDDLDIELGKLKQGLNTFIQPNDDGFIRLIIVISSGTSVTFKYAKVEQGAVATAYTAPNPIEEYQKCQRYFQYIHKLYCVPLAYTRDLISVLGKFYQATNGNLPTEMRITPTLTYNSLGQSDNSTFTGNASFELTSKSIDTVTLDQGITNFTITINGITLDAEIY